MVMNSIPDVSEYYAIFDDYLDFEIKPWDKHGVDEGEMIPERKVALRYLVLAMNIHKSDPSKLPTNLLTFMSDYSKPEYKEPESIVTVRDKRPRKKYADLIEEANAEAQQNQQQNKDGTNKVVVGGRSSSTGLSKQSMSGFNMAVRKGATTSDVIEKTDIVNRGPNRYIQTTTRSVFWDVPGEDSINPQTWDVSPYTSREDLEKIENAKTTKRPTRNK